MKKSIRLFTRWSLIFMGVLLIGYGMWRPTEHSDSARLCRTASATEQVPEAQVDAWWESLRGSLPEEIADEMTRIEQGESEMGFEYLFRLIWQGVTGEQDTFRRLFFTLLGIVVLGAAAVLLSGGEEKQSKPMGLILSTVCAMALWNVVSSSLVRVGDFISDLTTFSEGLVPVMAGVLAGGGAAESSIATATGFTMLMSVLEVLCGHVLAPLVSVCLAFTLVNAIAGDMHVGGIAGCLRGIYMTILGVMGVVATGAFAMQTMLATGTDTMAMRTARYTVGNMIPLIGGTIGAALGTIGSSLTVIKTTVGIGAVVACLMLTLPLLVSLYMTRLALNLTGAFAELMGFKTGEKILKDFRGIFDMTLAVTAFAATVFLIYVAVFLKTALPFAT